MTKSEFIYVVVRMSGAVIVAHAAWASLGFVSGLLMLSTHPAASSSLTVPFVGDSVIRILFEVAVGFYLLLDGRLLYFILNRER